MSLADLQLGSLSQMADACSDAQKNAATFQRLAQKTNKKASTRASAAAQSLWWQQQALHDCAVPGPTAVLPAPSPNPTPGTTGILPPPSVPVTLPPSTGGPYPAYNIPPQNYDTSALQAGPYISPSIPADVVAAITGASPLPVGGGASIPAPTGGAEIVECSPEYQAALPLQYADQWGPMQVVQIRCVG